MHTRGRSQGEWGWTNRRTTATTPPPPYIHKDGKLRRLRRPVLINPLRGVTMYIYIYRYMYII